MPAKKKSVTTPLHLLQHLSHSLIEHLDKACTQAQKDAEDSLAKLQKQRGKVQDKLLKARAKLDDAGSAGKTKAQTRARARIDELEESLALLQARQSETLTYITELKRDAEQSLALAQGIREVADAADQALQARKQPAASKAPATRSATSRPAAAATGASKPAPTRARAAKASTATAQAPAVEAPPRAKPARSRAKPAASAQPASAAQPVAKPAARKPAAKPAAAKKPAARKPAAKPASTAAQAPSSSN
ncbi:AlgP family protein [Pseudomonas lopnurensis]|uniref:AlgP family protein n=1 Tax=Pseudomonas lopnurensis TaxID=1477517 RepID=UPI0028ADBC61|nr:AlgP family protein [Pseudomonas lopnurensis]